MVQLHKRPKCPSCGTIMKPAYMIYQCPVDGSMTKVALQDLLNLEA